MAELASHLMARAAAPLTHGPSRPRPSEQSSAAPLQYHRDLEPLRDAAQNSELTAVHHPGTTAVRQLASRIRHAATPATPATTLASRRRGLSRP